MSFSYAETSANSRSRSADHLSETNAIWNFSSTEPLLSSRHGKGTTFYGGLRTAWDPSKTYNPIFALISNDKNLRILVNSGGNSSANRIQGVLFWKKEDFQKNSEGKLSFKADDTMSVTFDSTVGTRREFRFVVKEAGVYYVSASSFDGQVDTQGDIFSITPAVDSLWAELDTSTYTSGSFAEKKFEDISGVGFYFDYSRPNGLVKLELSGFETSAQTRAQALIP